VIKITDKKNCCGCNACGDVCSRNAIIFKTDNEGFWYPEADNEKCTNCGLCEKVCPVTNIAKLKKNDFEKPHCYAAIHKNLGIRLDSSSGGLFSALAEKMYRDGGYVGGAIYNEDFSVSHFISNDKQDLSRLRNSKYLQSDATGFYKEVKRLLVKGEKVLVCGTPCQMTALRAFLSKNYEDLLIVDLICNAVCSPKSHRKYLDALETKFDSKVVSLNAKHKKTGWENSARQIIFANGKIIYLTRREDVFSRAFIADKIKRPSCFHCVFKGFPRIADISLGDYWEIKNVAKELDDDMGVSAVIINSQKGERYFNAIKNKLKTKETMIESMKQPSLVRSLPLPQYDRNAFFEDMDKMDFFDLSKKHFPLPKDSIRRKVRGYLDYVKSTIHWKYFLSRSLRDIA
jgi:coenzyme F420-reducing hydrogenase beta subunit